MFISKLEKQEIQKELERLSRAFEAMEGRLIFLTAKKKVDDAKQEVKPRQKSAAQKAKQAVYMKAYHARRRAEKIAMKSAKPEAA